MKLSENITLEVIRINTKENSRYMVSYLVVEMLPTLGGPTLKSEMMRLNTGKASHPELVNPPTIRSFN